jgi:formylglycine-generating enzyme required for sulfatase activity
VLALDEEVVERGIAHRYQAYTSAAQGQTPITGAEYLEKLIHLPIRLPRPHGSEAQQYLADHWPQLYAKLPSVPPPLEPNELAKLAATLAPPVPRKLQRLTSLVLLNESLAGQLAAKDRSAMPGAEQRRWLVLMCALQLFAPSLFRYLRLHGADLLLELALWRKDMRLRDLTALSQELRSETLAVTEPYKLREAYAREGLPERIQGVLSNRSGFSLLTWLEQLQQQQDRAAPDGITLQRLLALAVAEAVVPLTTPHPSAEVPESSEEAQNAGGPTEGMHPSDELLQAPLPDPLSPVPTTNPSPQESAWVLRSDGNLLRARLENEFALWEPVIAGDPAFVQKALTREGAALAGKYLPESLIDGLVNFANGPIHSWLTQPLAQRKPMAQLLGPFLTQGDLLRFVEIDPANLGVFERPSWSAESRAERYEGMKLVCSARTPLFEADGSWIWLPFAEPAISPVAQALVSSRAWVAHPVQMTASGSTLALGADGEYGLYLDLTLKGSTQRLRWMEPGSFLMGSSDGQVNSNEHPQHLVTLRQGFWLADTLCTQSLWMAVMGANPSHVTDVDAVTELPVECVSSEDVTEFLQQLASLLPAQLKPDLPTEAEWEYTCRAGSQTLYWWGNDVQDGVNWAGGDGLGTTTPVRTYSPNPWGLHDMYGNVREWCADDQRRYSMDERVDPKGSVSGQSRAVRGGSYSDAPSISTSASRGRRSRDYRSPLQGFRFALRSSSPEAEPIRSAEPA